MAIQKDLDKTLSFESRIYTDMDFNFGKSSVKDLKLKSGENSIKQSIKNLLMVSDFERPFSSSDSLGLQHYLFEPITGTTELSIEKSIEDTINTYESRVIVENVDVVGDENRNRYSISFEFSILNSEETKTVEFFLERLR